MKSESCPRYGENAEAFRLHLISLNTQLRRNELAELGVPRDEVVEILLYEIRSNGARGWPLTTVLRALFPSLGRKDQ